ncbi:GNAT family protein [Devosia sp.]|uniref:GNAT family N-acetyltransferase n=1 Tax=Devosia sp. TaxID=1871048 RepID=UPI001B1A8A54|nr:GNAT family protein [Devosia sp.]MBO9587772.1 GNAT family N-acetyltransferase [Devosia sp.]
MAGPEAFRGAPLRTAVQDLVLKELGPADAEAFHALVQNNRAHLTSYGDFEQEVAAPLEKWTAEFASAPNAGCRFGIFLAGRLIGRVDIIAVDPPRYSIGYWLEEAAVGRGYAGAAVARLVTLAREELSASDLYAGVTHGNVRSEALLGRLGFAPVANFERYKRYHLPIRRSTV